MRNIKIISTYRPAIALLAGALIWTMSLAGTASAQRTTRASGMIAAGTTISVRTNEEINTSDSDGRVYAGVVDQDVMGANGNVAIPRKSPVELLVKKISDNEVALDLDAVMVNGQRYGVETEENVVVDDRKDGVGTNGRTGKYVGGGALLGAIIGGITGGGKGAAIGAGAGAAAGAGAQVLTRGARVKLPVESLLTFRLEQPLRAGAGANSVTRDGVRYRPGYANNTETTPAYQAANTAAYRDGMRAGRSDWDRKLARNVQSRRWTSAQDRRDYEAGYNQAYQSSQSSQSTQGAYDNSRLKPGYYNGGGSVSIGMDNKVTWQGPQGAVVYGQVDNQALRPFASGQSGTQLAPWIAPGHMYVFILKDANGNEIARDQVDLRSNRRRP